MEHIRFLPNAFVFGFGFGSIVMRLMATHVLWWSCLIWCETHIVLDGREREKWGLFLLYLTLAYYLTLTNSFSLHDFFSHILQLFWLQVNLQFQFFCVCWDHLSALWHLLVHPMYPLWLLRLQFMLSIWINIGFLFTTLFFPSFSNSSHYFKHILQIL